MIDLNIFVNLKILIFVKKKKLLMLIDLFNFFYYISVLSIEIWILSDVIVFL